MSKAANTLQKTQQNTIAKNPNKRTVQIKVMDFTILNGIKFGFGIIVGFTAFDFASTIIAFLFRILMVVISSGGTPM